MRCIACEAPTEEEIAEYNRLGKKLGRLLNREKTSLEAGLNTLSGVLLTNVVDHITEGDRHAAALMLAGHYTQVAEYYEAEAVRH